MLHFDQQSQLQSQLQDKQQQLLPQAYLTNFHNRIRSENVPIFVTAQPSRGHKRARVVNYAEVDNDIFDEFSAYNKSSNGNDRNATRGEDRIADEDEDMGSDKEADSEEDHVTDTNGGAGNVDGDGVNNDIHRSLSRSNANSTSNLSMHDSLRANSSTVSLSINNVKSQEGLDSNVNNNDNADLNTLDLKNDDDEEFEKFKFDEDGNLYDNVNGVDGNGDNGNSSNGDNDTVSNNIIKTRLRRKESNDTRTIKENSLPDIECQEDLMSVLRYPKIKATFSQSKIATPYRLDIPSPLSIDQQEPILIPVNLNIEHNGHTIIDHFIWNVNDHSITPEEFSTIYCRDIDFANSNALQSQIVSTINEQIQENITVASVVVPDLHVIINLTCNLGEKFYEDNFQWNLNDKSLSPEKFAEIVVQDLGLTRDYISIISFSLHENILKIKKEWLDGQLNVDHVPNGSAFGYLSGIRLDLDHLGADWCPKVETLTPEEIQRREIEKERNLRRLKRESDRLGRRGRRRVDELETTLKI
ncbi:hypothetical protein TPHA_0K01520 [Tetrapisispora phaffii CBS 4417]|uniref:Chromatin structure-remodeling complex subunit SFH1 n=1 Tax=Tetrapisispora phaffii (strain ATCC 24235 / CBS 4417 / NBRC 1672 / NRRL Y-8282 / UCD 70-5) TaxID=1071381 RepID=G8BZF7_TETPH|nr:hypothetical protein TPHA_0K01520 [Tetrapisispora phaffii CBS 4417]CCE65285.1 hypothetical protein TPHA_0K01520 [Tetrapisispora phaffii CBS 4417]